MRNNLICKIVCAVYPSQIIDMPIKVAIYEDDPSQCDYLRLLINGYVDYEVVGAFPNCNNVVSDLADIQPDVVIMDIDLRSTLNGIEGARLLKEHQPTVHIIMYTVFEEEDKLFEALCAGAGGYLLKKTPPHRLLESIREIMEGGSPMSPGIARKVIGFFHRPSPAVAYQLSEKELEILQLLVEGLPIKVIAPRVFLSIDGVKKNLRNIYDKLHVSCGKEAVAKAIRERIIS